MLLFGNINKIIRFIRVKHIKHNNKRISDSKHHIKVIQTTNYE
jgi:hypothetical protein